MMVYLLAIASPTHGVPPELYYTGWAGESKAAVDYRKDWSNSDEGDHYVNGHTYDGIKLDVGVGSAVRYFSRTILIWALIRICAIAIPIISRTIAIGSHQPCLLHKKSKALQRL